MSLFCTSWVLPWISKLYSPVAKISWTYRKIVELECTFGNIAACNFPKSKFHNRLLKFQEQHFRTTQDSCYLWSQPKCNKKRFSQNFLCYFTKFKNMPWCPTFSFKYFISAWGQTWFIRFKRLKTSISCCSQIFSSSKFRKIFTEMSPAFDLL